LSVGQISIEQALIAAGVNLLLPFGPAFCFAVIVFFSLEYKTLGLAGEPLVAAGVNPLVPFYINPLVHAGSLGQALIFCFFWIKPKEETFLGYS